MWVYGEDVNWCAILIVFVRVNQSHRMQLYWFAHRSLIQKRDALDGRSMQSFVGDGVPMQTSGVCSGRECRNVSGRVSGEANIRVRVLNPDVGLSNGAKLMAF